MTNDSSLGLPPDGGPTYFLVVGYEIPDDDGAVRDALWQLRVRAGQLPVPRAGETMVFDPDPGPSVDLVVDKVRHWISQGDPHPEVFVYARPESAAGRDTVVTLDQQNRVQQWLNKFPAVVADSVIVS